MLLKSILSASGIREILNWSVQAEAWWFDVVHGVRTRAGKADQAAFPADPKRNFWYLPTRPGVARAILRDLELQNHTQYTFVDFGSGKGRVLLLAAEYPFKKIKGIELSRSLHEQALENVDRYSKNKNRRAFIECANIDAVSYQIPDEPLVLYFFNPFGEEVMRKILNRVDESIRLRPRDVLVAMYYAEPELWAIADSMPHLKLWKQTRLCRIYRSCV